MEKIKNKIRLYFVVFIRFVDVIYYAIDYGITYMKCKIKFGR